MQVTNHLLLWVRSYEDALIYLDMGREQKDRRLVKKALFLIKESTQKVLCFRDESIRGDFALLSKKKRRLVVEMIVNTPSFVALSAKIFLTGEVSPKEMIRAWLQDKEDEIEACIDKLEGV